MIYDAGAGGVGAVDLRRLEEVFGRAGGGAKGGRFGRLQV